MASNGGPHRAETGQTAELDGVDRSIIDALRAEGRISMRLLAERLHISRANAYARVERLHERGVITGYAAVVNPQRAGYGVAAYVYLKITQHSWKTVEQRLTAIAEVEHGALVSGEFDMVLLVRTRDAADLRQLVLSQLQGIPDVLSTQTVLIFDELPVADRVNRP